jgi:hypothetical protein
MSSIESTMFLRRVLLIDALSSGAMGLLLATCAGLLGGMLDLPAAMLEQAGIVLLPFALMLAFLGSRAQPPKVLVSTVIVVNAIWAFDSFVLLLSGWVQPNVRGYAFVAGQAVFVALMAELEFVGLRKFMQLTAAGPVNGR